MKPSARIEIRTACARDIPDLRRNWKAAFGDEDAYLDFFFSGCFRAENTLVCAWEDTVVSQLFLLPAMLRAEDRQYPVCYLYAAATHPAYRVNGCMAQLLKAAETLCRERGIFGIVLLPASETLYAYYARFGYETAFYRRVWNVSRAELKADAQNVRVSAEDAEAFVETYSKRHNGIVWNSEQLQYALAEHRTFRGAYGAVKNKAFAAAEDNEALLLAEPDDITAGCSALLQLSDAEQLRITLAPEHTKGELQKRGMIRFLAERIELTNAFISFALE